MPRALVTGLRPHLGPAAANLARAGFNVVTWETPASSPLPDGPFDCYVQMPCGGAAIRTSGRSRTRGGRAARGAGEFLCRIDTLAAVASQLRPNASVLLGVDENQSASIGLEAAPTDPLAGPRPDALAPDLLAAVALALLEDLGRPATRVAALSVEDLCRPAPAFARIDPVVGATQWEMPTPPLVSAP
jgi:hypothetical protein